MIYNYIYIYIGILIIQIYLEDIDDFCKIAISRKFENIPSVSSPIGYLWNCLDKSHQPPILPWFNGEIPTLLESNLKILMKFWTTPAKFLVIFHEFPNIFSFSSDGIHWNPPFFGDLRWSTLPVLRDGHPPWERPVGPVAAAAAGTIRAVAMSVPLFYKAL